MNIDFKKLTGLPNIADLIDVSEVAKNLMKTYTDECSSRNEHDINIDLKTFNKELFLDALDGITLKKLLLALLWITGHCLKIK